MDKQDVVAWMKTASQDQQAEFIVEQAQKIAALTAERDKQNQDIESFKKILVSTGKQLADCKGRLEAIEKSCKEYDDIQSRLTKLNQMDLPK